MCLYPLISSASCCNFAKHLLDPLHGAASVQVGVWATAGDCGYSVPRLGILGASHDMGKHVSLPKTWSGQHLAACIHVLAVYWWGCRGLHTGSRPPDSASSEADDQFLEEWRQTVARWRGTLPLHPTPIHSPANQETINPHIVFCKIHQQRICAAELDNFT